MVHFGLDWFGLFFCLCFSSLRWSELAYIPNLSSLCALCVLQLRLICVVPTFKMCQSVFKTPVVYGSLLHKEMFMDGWMDGWTWNAFWTALNCLYLTQFLTDLGQILDSKSYDQANKPYGIIWSQNVHFVTTSSFNENGSVVSSLARFFVFCFMFYVLCFMF